MICFPNAKINLGLYITGKRKDGFHDLSTIFYPVPLRDALEIIATPGTREPVMFSKSGTSIAGPDSDNLCIKAWQLIKTDFPQLPNIKIHLHKNIPQGAGLGGGSADGAYTLKLLNQKFNLNISPEILARYAMQLGSDCPFFMFNVPCIATGRGEILQPVALNLSNYFLVLVHPGIHIHTGHAFLMVKPKPMQLSLEALIQEPLENWQQQLRNDFEPPVFEQYPALKEIKDRLYQKGAVFAAMTGTGSTIYGLFNKEPKEIDFGFPKGYFYFSEKLSG